MVDGVEVRPESELQKEPEHSNRFLDEVRGSQHPSFSRERQDHYDRINVDINICVSTHEKASDQAKCWQDGEKVWDNELKTTYKGLMDDLKNEPESQQKLRQSELEWDKFRDKEFAAIDKLYKDAPSSLELAPDVANDKTWVIEARVKELQSLKDASLLPLNPGEPLDQFLHACLDASKPVDAQKHCLNKASAGWNEEMNTQYASLSPKQEKALAPAQEQWKAFQKANQEFLDAHYPKDKDGTSSLASLAASFNLVRDRAIQVSLRESDHYDP